MGTNKRIGLETARQLAEQSVVAHEDARRLTQRQAALNGYVAEAERPVTATQDSR